MDLNIQLIAQLIIPIIGLIVTYLLVPYLKANTTQKQRDSIYFWVQLAVQAAEQIFSHVKGAGSDKKEFVLEFLKEKGIKVSKEDLNILIEAAVLELNRVKSD
jgi:hypothetical protein